MVGGSNPPGSTNYIGQHTLSGMKAVDASHAALFAEVARLTLNRIPVNGKVESSQRVEIERELIQILSTSRYKRSDLATVVPRMMIATIHGVRFPSRARTLPPRVRFLIARSKQRTVPEKQPAQSRETREVVIVGKDNLEEAIRYLGDPANPTLNLHRLVSHLRALALGKKINGQFPTIVLNRLEELYKTPKGKKLIEQAIRTRDKQFETVRRQVGEFAGRAIRYDVRAIDITSPLPKTYENGRNRRRTLARR